jgi:hydrogenase small subunit
MKLTRRDFLKMCGISAATLGLSQFDLLRLHEALANDSAPPVIWLQGSSCTGCSVSFLNRVRSTTADTMPNTVADILVDNIKLAYHPNLMAVAGEDAAEQALFQQPGSYVLAIEGGIPTAFGGAACWAWSTEKDGDVTFKEAVGLLAPKAAKILAIGTCAGWGGIPGAVPDPTLAKGVGEYLGAGYTSKIINIAVCPPHPDWITWVVVQLILGNSISLDNYGRPRQFFRDLVHERCPRKEGKKTETYGVDKACLEELGCRGPQTHANCPSLLWNNRTNWCIDANAPCMGCTEPGFPWDRLLGEGAYENRD